MLGKNLALLVIKPKTMQLLLIGWRWCLLNCFNSTLLVELQHMRLCAQGIPTLVEKIDI